MGGPLDRAVRGKAIETALLLTTEQITRLRLLLRIFYLGTGLAYLIISGVYVIFTDRLRGIASYRVLLDAMPPWGWSMLFLLSGTMLILAGTLCPTWKRTTMVAAAALAFWQGTAYAFAPFVDEGASPMLAVLYVLVAFYLVLGAMFARVQQVAHEADGAGPELVKQAVSQAVDEAIDELGAAPGSPPSDVPGSTSDPPAP